ncbi:hypothetical protein ACFODL_06905 [Phenylobacterium terrae]|uniref:Uncharacterized protein n=1 Tax=Phenylobacterium terrae TaxID=2665495 RepID=A0ABW4N675_9CAUL
MKSFEARELHQALSGNWLTLALAHFETPFTTSFRRNNSQTPVAYGVVHFDTGVDQMIPAELTLRTDATPDRARVGTACFSGWGRRGEPMDYVLLNVVVDDPRALIADRLHQAFLSAAACRSRFVHVSFRREPHDVTATIQQLRERGYSSRHDLAEMTFARSAHLSDAPSWAWTWRRP